MASPGVFLRWNGLALCLATTALAACSMETIRNRTDHAYFLGDGVRKELATLKRSPSHFTKEMVDRGGSCIEGRRAGNPTRIVCMYAYCRNGGTAILGWQFDYSSRTVLDVVLDRDTDFQLMTSQCHKSTLEAAQVIAGRSYITSKGEDAS